MRRSLAVLLLVCSASAVRAQPHIGAPYGARDPHTCPSRHEPTRGAPSVAQATQYFLCDTEVEQGGSVAMNNLLYLASDVKLEVAPKSRRFNPRTDSMRDIDPEAPIYDIRGSFTQYQCARPESGGAGTYPLGHNCRSFAKSNATGFCYKNTFGDWHCSMDEYPGRETGRNLPPPKTEN